MKSHMRLNATVRIHSATASTTDKKILERYSDSGIVLRALILRSTI